MFSKTRQMRFYNLNNLQGSQTRLWQLIRFLKFYNLNNLQGSQTKRRQEIRVTLFYNLNNLQGSQTVLCLSDAAKLVLQS